MTEASEQLRMFGDEPIASRATELDNVVEDLIASLDKQSLLLDEAGLIFNLLEKVCYAFINNILHLFYH